MKLILKWMIELAGKIESKKVKELFEIYSNYIAKIEELLIALYKKIITNVKTI